MVNNDVLRRVRYVFDLNDKRMIALFKLGQKDISRAQMSDLLRKEDDAAFVNCTDRMLAHFLNGFIIDRRGPQEGEPPVAEARLSNNLVLRKLKIALELTTDDILAMFELANFRFSKSELGALLRKPGHKNYRECKDQVLRNFLHGMQLKYRPVAPEAAQAKAKAEPVDAKQVDDADNPWLANRR